MATHSLWNLADQFVSEVQNQFPGLENTAELTSRVLDVVPLPGKNSRSYKSSGLHQNLRQLFIAHYITKMMLKVLFRTITTKRVKPFVLRAPNLQQRHINS